MANPALQAHLEALAHQQAYQAYLQKQYAARMNNGIQGTGYSTGPQDQPAPPPQNWLQRLVTSIPGTPAYLLGKVNDAFGKATGQ